MKVSQSFPVRRVALALALIMLFSGIRPFIRPARAEPIAPPAADAPAKPVEVGSLSIASLDRLGKLAKEIGVNLPPVLTPSGISQQFAFLGPDGLDPDAPIGILLYSASGYEVAKGQGMVFVLPVKPGAAPLSGFSDAGGKPIEGHADSVDLNGATFRRTEKDLMFSPTELAVTAVPANELVELFKNPADAGARKNGTPLVRFIFDLNAFRQVNPERFKSFMDGIRASSAPPKDDAERYGQDLVFNFVQGLGKVDVAVSPSNSDIDLALAIAPAHVPRPRARPKPGMPSNVIMRLDLAGSPLKLIPSLNDLLTKLAKSIPVGNAKPGTPQEQKQLLEFFKAVPPVFGDGEAVSFGLESQGGGAVVYIVQQKVTVDLASRLQIATEQFKKASTLMDQPDDKSAIEVDHYDLPAGLVVTRTRILHNGKVQAYIDATEKDGNDYLTVSAQDGKRLNSLIGLQPHGTLSALAHLEIDMEGMVTAAESVPNSEVAKMTPAQRKIFKNIFHGHMFTFTATGKDDSIVFNTTIPQAVVARLAAIAQQGKAPDQAP